MSIHRAFLRAANRRRELARTLTVRRHHQGEGWQVVDQHGRTAAYGFDTEDEAKQWINAQSQP